MFSMATPSERTSTPLSSLPPPSSTVPSRSRPRSTMPIGRDDDRLVVGTRFDEHEAPWRDRVDALLDRRHVGRHGDRPRRSGRNETRARLGEVGGNVADDHGPGHARVLGAVERAVVRVDAWLVEAELVLRPGGECFRIDPEVGLVGDGDDVVLDPTVVLPLDRDARIDADLAVDELVVDRRGRRPRGRCPSPAFPRRSTTSMVCAVAVVEVSSVALSESSLHAAVTTTMAATATVHRSRTPAILTHRLSLRPLSRLEDCVRGGHDLG